MPDYTTTDAPIFSFPTDRSSTYVDNVTFTNQINTNTTFQTLVPTPPVCLYVSALSAEISGQYVPSGWQIKFAAPLTAANHQAALLTLVQNYVYVPLPTIPTRIAHEHRNPNSTDDTTQQFSLGSTWYNAVSDTKFLCTNAAAGNAVWVKIQVNPKVAIIKVDGTGTHANLPDAISAGVKSIILEEGTHTIDSPLTIPTRTQIQCNSLGGVFVRAIGTGCLIVDGSIGHPVINTGSISITSGTNIVTGNGVDWVVAGVEVGQHIEVGPTFIEITAVSASSLTLQHNYYGKSLTSATYWIQSMSLGIILSRFIFYNESSSATKGIHIKSCRNSAIFQMSISNFVDNVYLEDCGQFFLTGGLSQGATSTGIVLDNCLATCIHTMGISGCGAYGLRVLESDNSEIHSINVNSNVVGISIESNSKYTSVQVVAANNYSNAIQTDNTTSNSSIHHCQINGSGNYGIKLSGSFQHVDNNQVSNSVNHNIYSENLVDGTLSYNHCLGSTADAIHCGAGSHRNSIQGNKCKNSTGYGIRNVVGNTEQMILHNSCHVSTIANFLDSGTSTIVANNQGFP